MRVHETPPASAGAYRQESSQSHTDRLVANAEAMLAEGGRSLAQSDATLKHSRELASANVAADARAPFTRLCMGLAKEMEDVGFQPTVDQVKSWRDRLITSAIATTGEKDSNGG